MEAIDPQDLVENYPKSTLCDTPLTASKHIMEQPYFKDRLEQIKEQDTAKHKQKLKDYKQVAIWTVEDIKDQHLIFLPEEIYKLTILVIAVHIVKIGYSECLFSDSTLAQYAIHRMLHKQDKLFYMFIGKSKDEAIKAFIDILCKDIKVYLLNYFQSDNDQDILLHVVLETSTPINEITYKAQNYVKNKHNVYLTNKHLSTLMTKLNTKEQSVNMANILNKGDKPTNSKALGCLIQHKVQLQLEILNRKPTKKQKKLQKNSSAPDKVAYGKTKKQ